MKPLTLEWIEKAEGDWIVALQCYRARKHPNYDASCFHCQQSAEKYLKAHLTEAGVTFPKTHDLISLLTLALPTQPNWASLRPQLRTLNAFAVFIRYPGKSATKAEAKDALRDCKEVRKVVRTSFRLPL